MSPEERRDFFNYAFMPGAIAFCTASGLVGGFMVPLAFVYLLVAASQ